MLYISDKDVENVINARDRHCRIGKVTEKNVPASGPVIPSKVPVWRGPYREWWNDPYSPTWANPAFVGPTAAWLN